MSYRTRTLSLDTFRRQVELLDPDLPLAVGSIDIDDFGTYNQREGYEAGDRALAAIEDALVAGLPAEAFIGHVKGDEWVVALLDAMPEDLLIALDGVRRRLDADGPLPITGGVAG